MATRLRFGFVAPIVTLIFEKPAEAERDMKPRVPVARARLEQKHAVPARLRQPIGQNAPGAACPHDDEIERPQIRHALSLVRPSFHILCQ
jgi:hypothetical protein